MTDAYTVLQLAEAAGVIILGVGSTFFSRRAAKLSEPTSNGWTEGLGRRLDRQDRALARIEDHLIRVESKIDGHLHDHLTRKDRDDGC